MKIALDLMTRLMRRVSNNPFASHKTRARNLLLRLQEEGYQVTRSTAEPETPVFDPLHALLEAPPTEDNIPYNTSAPVPVGLTRKEQARLHYNAGDWVALYDLKKSSKVYWDRLGFDQMQIGVIKRNEP